MEEKIPKILHYCWFGKSEYPSLVSKCIESWKKILPDYEFMLWNEETFDIESVKWTKDAYEAKKWAFVADYVRLKVLYEYGGIYLDTDIQMKKSFNDLLNQEIFLGFECDNVLSAGVIGCHKENKIIKLLLEYYDKPFDLENIMNLNMSNALAMTKELESYGLKTDNTEQFVLGAHIYPKTYFNPRDYWGNWDMSKDTYCIHLYMGSWLSEGEQKKLAKRRNCLINNLRKFYLLIKKNKIIYNFRNKLKEKNII